MTTANFADDGVYQTMNPTPKKVTYRTQPTVSRPMIRGFHMVPDTVACEGTTTVALIFDEIPDSSDFGKVEISVRSNEKTDRIVATRINQRSFRFTAPKNRVGEVPVMIFVNEKEVASSHLSYRQEIGSSLVTGMTQMHLQILTEFCRYLYVLQTKHQLPNLMPELDQFLVEWFDDKGDKNKIPPKVFEELFDMSGNEPSDVIQSSHEFPTLLHFTAGFGLGKFAEKLMDLPGAERASQVLNAHRLTSSAIAHNNGYSAMAMMLSRSNKSDVINCPEPPKIIRSSKGTIVPSDIRRFMKSYNDGDNGDYVLPDSSQSPDEIEDTYFVTTPGQMQSVPTSEKPPATKRTPPKTPAKAVRISKAASDVGSSSRPAYEVPRDSHAHHDPPPVVPRRESRDSGTYVDGAEPAFLPPPTTAPRSRQGVTRGDSDPVIVNNHQQGRLSDSNSKLSKLSDHDIRLQLSKQIPAHPGSRGPSITK